MVLYILSYIISLFIALSICKCVIYNPRYHLSFDDTEFFICFIPLVNTLLIIIFIPIFIYIIINKKFHFKEYVMNKKK